MDIMMKAVVVNFDSPTSVLGKKEIYYKKVKKKSIRDRLIEVGEHINGYHVNSICFDTARGWLVMDVSVVNGRLSKMRLEFDSFILSNDVY